MNENNYTITCDNYYISLLLKSIDLFVLYRFSLRDNKINYYNIVKRFKGYKGSDIVLIKAGVLLSDFYNEVLPIILINNNSHILYDGISLFINNIYNAFDLPSIHHHDVIRDCANIVNTYTIHVHLKNYHTYNPKANINTSIYYRNLSKPDFLTKFEKSKIINEINTKYYSYETIEHKQKFFDSIINKLHNNYSSKK